MFKEPHDRAKWLLKVQTLTTWSLSVELEQCQIISWLSHRYLLQTLFSLALLVVSSIALLIAIAKIALIFLGRWWSSRLHLRTVKIYHFVQSRWTRPLFIFRHQQSIPHCKRSSFVERDWTTQLLLHSSCQQWRLGSFASHHFVLLFEFFQQ